MATLPQTLHESLLLLALKDREGTVGGGTLYTYAIGGGVLAELLLAGRIAAETRRKRTYAAVVDPTPLGDPLADAWLVRIRDTRRPRQLVEWVSRIAAARDLKHQVALQLCRRGVLRSAEDEVLWIFTRRVYPEVDPGPERRLREAIEAAVLGDGEVEPRTAVLVALAHHAGILTQVLGKGRLRARKARLEAIAQGDACARATREAIHAMQAAVAVAAMMPALAAATAAAAAT